MRIVVTVQIEGDERSCADRPLRFAAGAQQKRGCEVVLVRSDRRGVGVAGQVEALATTGGGKSSRLELRVPGDADHQPAAAIIARLNTLTALTTVRSSRSSSIGAPS